MSRIPRGPLATLDGNVPHQASHETRMKAKPGSKRPCPDADAIRPLKDQDGWEEISESTGLTIQGLLDIKMTGKGKHDLKGKLDQCMGYIKQLRACIRFLDTETQMLEADRDSMETALENSHAENELHAKAAAEAAAVTERKLEGEAAKLAAALTSAEAMETEISAMQDKLTAAKYEAERAADRIAALELEVAKFSPQLEEAHKQLANSQEQYNKAQEYIANLQEYNAQKQRESIALNTEKLNLQEQNKTLTAEVAQLTGNATVTQAQLDSTKSALTDSEKSRLEAQQDCNRLRADLTQIIAERDNLARQLSEASDKLDEYDRTSGRAVRDLRDATAARDDFEKTAARQADDIYKLNAEIREVKAQLQDSQAEACRLTDANSALKLNLAEVQESLTLATNQVHAHEAHRRKLHNTILEIKGNIRVFCRLRPPTEPDERAVVKALLDDGTVYGSGVELHMPGADESQGSATQMFTFDRVFDHGASQEDVFSEISQLVQSALDGQKVCIFAYGQTGSGKTHTMMGDAFSPGMIPRAMEQILCSSKQLEEQGWAFQLRASMLEIYNEEYKDLLGKGLPPGKTHKVIHDGSGNTSVSDLVVIDVSRPGSFETLMEKALAHRSVGSTSLNERSSRSHCVFTLHIEGQCESTSESIKGVLNLIDLAGSERLSKSHAVGERLKETQAINKSLSALGDVIAAIGSRAEHVPFRNSKLTWLLQPCLGKDAKTLMFVNVAPSASAANESLCSLRFATKVNACEVGGMRRSRSGPLKN